VNSQLFDTQPRFSQVVSVTSNANSTKERGRDSCLG
jgi:hypothetical protein